MNTASSQLAYLNIKSGKKGGTASLAPSECTKVQLPTPMKLTN